MIQTVPWLSDETSEIKNPNTRLHNEIIEFYDYIRPSKEDHKKRVQICQTLKDILEGAIKDAYLIPFGSFATQLYLPTSDIDLGLISEVDDEIELIRKTREVLGRHEDRFENIQCVLKAKVRLIKFIDTKTKIELDMSFNQVNGLQNINEVDKALKIHPEIKYLVMVMKMFLKQRRMHETFTGGIGSFLLFCMILAFVRWHKKDMEERYNDIYSVNEIALGDILLRFLRFYGSFKINDDAIHMIDGGSIRKKESTDLEFQLFSPFEPERNIGGQSFKIKEIFAVFRNRCQILQNRAYSTRGSILKDLLNPQEQDFNEFLT